MEKGSFQKSPFSRDSREFRGQNFPDPLIPAFFFSKKARKRRKKNKDFLVAEPIKSLEKKGKTHNKSKDNRKMKTARKMKKKKHGLEGQGCSKKGQGYQNRAPSLLEPQVLF